MTRILKTAVSALFASIRACRAEAFGEGGYLVGNNCRIKLQTKYDKLKRRK
jgi:hypothetical protein